jgi:hypothetical protein
MRALSSMELLRVWEQGMAQPPAQRALSLLTLACAEMSPEQLARLSIGRRDERLLTLREWAFGPRLQSVAACPRCGEKSDVLFDVSDIRAGPVPESVEELSLTAGGHEVRFRLPNSTDLACLSTEGNISANQARLFERCVLVARRDGQELTAGQLPENVISAVQERMAQSDPQADVRLELTCPSCQHRWLATFDIGSFFWSEISAWATRLLREIHILASAYGWNEAEILSVSPRRRQAYLEMVGA